MLIGILGKARSGKDEAAKVLVEELGFTRFAFADPLKDAFAEYHGIPRCWCDGLTEDGTELDRETWVAFTEGAVGPMGLPLLRDVTIRQGLQRFGAALRDTFGPDFWVERTSKSISDARDYDYVSRVVITDVRYDNEVGYVKKKHPCDDETDRGALAINGILLGIDRPGVEAVAAHKSEELAGRLFEPGLCDHVISNGGTLEEFRDSVRDWARTL